MNQHGRHRFKRCVVNVIPNANNNNNLIIWQVITVLILPRLKVESAMIKQAQDGLDPVEKNAAENLKNLLLVCTGSTSALN